MQETDISSHLLFSNDHISGHLRPIPIKTRPPKYSTEPEAQGFSICIVTAYIHITEDKVLNMGVKSFYVAKKNRI